MKSSAAIRHRPWQSATLCLCILVLGAAVGSASAADCPGNPDALGTSRTLVVDPREHPRIGTMQYAETLPLEDHEVVLTFDDGPLPRNSNQILAILASQCVKATFFTIGQMARAYPEGVRKLRDAGHTIGTHTQNHPLFMKRLPIERARQEIDDGIASVTAALGDPNAVAPFFRIPGLSRAEAVEDYMASLGIQVWSADFPADDWRDISSSRVFELAMQRLEAKGKGILLLHDIQARTVVALPRILHELKVRGYRIVQVVPATPERPKTPTEPRQWQMHPTVETVAVWRWPAVPAFARTDMLAAPNVSGVEEYHELLLLGMPEMFDRSITPARGAVPLPREAPWPRLSPIQAAAGNTPMLPVPEPGVFQIPEQNSVAIEVLAPPSHHAEQAPVPSGEEAHSMTELISPDGNGVMRPGQGDLPTRRTSSQPGPAPAPPPTHDPPPGVSGKAAHHLTRLRSLPRIKERSS
jgi:peptidoglycan/xylan/chitin deacetylase (PgdA/CDA1 family)